MGDPRLRDAIRLDAIVATVDAVNGAANLDSQPVAERQSAVADRRVITKSDLADACEIARLVDRLRSLNPGADIKIVTDGQIAADQLFGASLYDSKQGKADVGRWLGLEAHRAAGHDHGSRGDEPAHGQSVRTWLVEEDRPVEWAALSDRLKDVIDRHGNVLLRLKGVIWTSDDPRPLVIHGVQRLFHRPVRIENWPGKPRTSIVLIGSEGALEAKRLIAEALTEAARAVDRQPQRELVAAMAKTSKIGGVGR
jgi:G3E family GTPase